MKATIYKQRANGRWEYWTHSDGERIRLTEQGALRLLNQRNSDYTLVTLTY